MKPMQRFLDWGSTSKVVQLVLSAGALPAAGDAILFALSLGGSLYAFLFWAWS